MPAAAGAGNAAASACAAFNGVYSSVNGGTCCKDTCGLCTGLDECKNLEGGETACCTGVIQELGIVCGYDSQAPCKLPPPTAVQNLVLTVKTSMWAEQCCATEPKGIAASVCTALATKLDLEPKTVSAVGASANLNCSSTCPELPSTDGLPEMVDMGVSCSVTAPPGVDLVSLLTEAQELGGLVEKIAAALPGASPEDVVHTDVLAPEIGAGGAAAAASGMSGAVVVGGAPADVEAGAEPPELDNPALTHPAGPVPPELKMSSPDTAAVGVDRTFRVSVTTFNDAPKWSTANRVLYCDWSHNWVVGPANGMASGATWLRSRNVDARQMLPQSVPAGSWERYVDATQEWVSASTTVTALGLPDEASTSLAQRIGGSSLMRSSSRSSPASLLSLVGADPAGPPSHAPTPASSPNPTGVHRPPTPDRFCANGERVELGHRAKEYCAFRGGYVTPGSQAKSPLQRGQRSKAPAARIVEAVRHKHDALVAVDADAALEHLRRGA